MPMIENDLVEVRIATVAGGKVNFCAKWKNGRTGEDKGELCSEWPSVEELEAFAGQQDWPDVLRVILASCTNKTTGRFDPAAFAALQGQSLRISQKVNAQ